MPLHPSLAVWGSAEALGEAQHMLPSSLNPGKSVGARGIVNGQDPEAWPGNLDFPVSTATGQTGWA